MPDWNPHDRTTLIAVNFDGQGKPVWPRVPAFHMHGEGTITLQRARNMDWEFSDIMFYDRANPDRRTSPADFDDVVVSADTIRIHDRDQSGGTYYYRYQINRNGTLHWSPDPEIDNDPR